MLILVLSWALFLCCIIYLQNLIGLWDILEQDIGGRENVSNLGESTVADNLDIAQYFLDNVNLAKKYLEDILGVKGNDSPEDDSPEDD